ncbi:DedA family protein [Alicyclobacillus vulcanalis]|uniref:Membrane protein DedA, SNARE-associated domain n=1 Tax=Alicyclobacillus vulcanalis TaxID=252246 RepID=A0A1N7P4T4_9BACL|nr:DedA family protein [Alicyclobacillus vulcanalis]SIT05591.1 membrane protein DedA, SNARE-associated domain [Alicyclobacillus vulcanalis]
METIREILQSINAGLLLLGYPGTYAAMVMEGLGLPFPGDVFLAFYGYAISLGTMRAPTVFSLSALGYFTGVTIVFLLTRRFQTLFLNPLYRLHLLNETRLKHTGGLMDRYAWLVLVPGRFLPGIRSLSTYAAALSDMPYATFALYSIVGSMVWCGAWLAFGYWFGENMDEMMKHVQAGLSWITVGIALCAILYWVWRQRMTKRRER